MKKHLAIAITALLLMSLTACQKVEDWENQKTKTTEETTIEEKTTENTAEETKEEIKEDEKKTTEESITEETPTEETTPTTDPSTTDTTSDTPTEENPVTTEEPTATIQEVKTFNITARQFEFTPNTISVNEGDKVVINLTSEDTEHGFAVTEYNISEIVTAGQTITIEFTADKKGTFTFKCPVNCGEGHTEMVGNLIVN